MATRCQKGVERARSRGALFRLLMVISALGAAGTAVAQPPDEIIVRGYRQSLDRALDIKRSETGAVDSIVAEDIADFPDLNLGRIPAADSGGVYCSGMQAKAATSRFVASARRSRAFA